MKERDLIIYLKERGISKRTAEDFHLSFYTNKFTFLGEEYNYKEFVSTMHRNSIIFPIFTVHGDLVAISSKNPKQKKYLHKGTKTDSVYGLYTTWKHIVEKNVVIVVEGNFDILKCYEKGLKYVTAFLGGAATYNQLCLLRRFTDRCIIAFDGDVKGRENGEKLKDQMLEVGFKCKQVNLPEDEDPDSFLDNHTKNAFLKLVQ